MCYVTLFKYFSATFDEGWRSLLVIYFESALVVVVKKGPKHDRP